MPVNRINVEPKDLDINELSRILSKFQETSSYWQDYYSMDTIDQMPEYVQDMHNMLCYIMHLRESEKRMFDVKRTVISSLNTKVPLHPFVLRHRVNTNRPFPTPSEGDAIPEGMEEVLKDEG